MIKEEMFYDWLFRYQFVYRSRLTNKKKTGFIKALVTDIGQMREDIKVIEYGQNKKSSFRNIYVGDIKKADRIICTYYDTPPKHFGPYVYFDQKRQGNQTSKYILISSILMIVLGVIGIFAYMKFFTNDFTLFSFQMFISTLLFGTYFFLFSKVTKGDLGNKNLIRNTSSVLTVLQMINTIKNSQVAFAFIDEGSYGYKGLDILSDLAKPNANIFYLDSIGSDEQLHAIGNAFDKSLLKKLEIDFQEKENKVNYLFSGKAVNKNGKQEFLLDQKELKRKKINNENISKVWEVLS